MVHDARDGPVGDRLAGRALDLVIDAVGSTAVIREATHLLKPGGKVGVFGVIRKGDARLDLLGLANHVCVHLLNWPYREHDVHGEVVELIERGDLDPRHFYSHVLPLSEAPRAVEMVRTREALKVVLAP
jgi:threonine dehydrogenase-like Zn-dependent dehydrogenase